MAGKSLRPSPALVVAIVALFVALGGTAGAVVTQVPPLAKRSLTADNAKKLGGKTLAQVVAQAAAAPGPASSAAGLFTVKTSTTSLAAQAEGEVTIACDAGQKVAGGGFSSDGAVFNLDSYPTTDGLSWKLYLVNAGSSPANIGLYATCIR